MTTLQHPPKSERRRRTPVSIPSELQARIRSFAAELIEQHGDAFEDSKMKTRIASMLRRALPPRPRARGYPEVTRAIRLLDELRRQHPDESPRALWRRIYREVIINYDAMDKLERLRARQELWERARWRLHQARRRARKRQTK